MLFVFKAFRHIFVEFKFNLNLKEFLCQEKMEKKISWQWKNKIISK